MAVSRRSNRACAAPLNVRYGYKRTFALVGLQLCAPKRRLGQNEYERPLLTRCSRSMYFTYNERKLVVDIQVEMVRKLATIGKFRDLLFLTILALVHTGCERTAQETSFGVEGTSFSCVDDLCEITFMVDNQFPHPVKIMYRAVLSSVGAGAILEVSDRINLPALEKTKVSRTVSVTNRPDRLRVTVTTLQGQ